MSHVEVSDLFFLLRGFALLERVVMDVAGGVLMHVDTDAAHLWVVKYTKGRAS